MNVNFKLIKENISIIVLSLGVLLILISINMALETINAVDISLLENNSSRINTLVINEILTDNEGVNIDEFGNLYDWIELYNGTDKDIDLTNYGLSDEDNGSIKWIFPEVIIKSKSYLVVYLTGKNSKGLYANFSLKKDGKETITLKNSKGKVVDAVKTLELLENKSMVRNSNGKWEITNEVTPGYENSVDGRQDFLYSLSELNLSVYPKISEILPVNEGNVIFDNNSLYSYLEVTNYTDEVINLHDFYLSDETEVLYKWRFPEYDLNPNESYLVYMNELDIDNNCSFDLKSKNGKVFLSNSNGVVDSFQYKNLTNGVSYVKQDDMWYKTSNISPGFINDTQGKIKFQEKYDVAKPTLLINEVMSSNTRYLAQNGNQYYDWIELYNNSSEDILLSDYTITTNSDDRNMYKLPNVVLKANSYYVFMASGDTSLSNDRYIHSNFKLSSGEGLFLYKSDQLIDSMFIYDIPKDNSYGRGDKFGHYFYSTATPGYHNGNNGIREIAYNPVFSNSGGIYNDVSSIEVKLTSSGDIYYTLDGSNPNINSIKYTKPILLSNTSVIKAIAYENNKKSSDIITNSYIVNEKHSLPVVSVSLKQQDYNYLTASLYSDRIVDAYVELYEDDSSFSTSCGLKLFGGQSRQLAKKSFSLKFSNKYSVSNLNYKVFDDKEIVEFGDLVLRSGSQDQASSMIRDEFVSKMLVNYGTLIAQDVKPAILYLNGKYWGIYYIREKINEKYVEDNYNVSGYTNIVDHLFRTEAGSNSSFIDLKNYIISHDMTNEDNYKYVSERLDIDNFIDYYVVEFIINNEDIHNVRFYNNSELDDGKIKVIKYDSDYSLIYNYGANYINFLVNHNGLKNPPDSSYLRGLLKNQSFKKRFVERISYYMKNVWTEENILTVYNELYNSIEPEMKRNSSRWNQSYDGWLKSIEKLKKESLNRIKVVPQATKAYFKLSDKEFYEYFK